MSRAITYTLYKLNHTDPPPISKWTEKAFVDHMRAMYKSASDDYDSYPILFLPPDYDMATESIIQQSGQHRGLALLHRYKLLRGPYKGYTPGLFQPSTVSVCLNRSHQQLWMANSPGRIWVGSVTSPRLRMSPLNT